jgi:hypothetical protein
MLSSLGSLSTHVIAQPASLLLAVYMYSTTTTTTILPSAIQPRREHHLPPPFPTPSLRGEKKKTTQSRRRPVWIPLRHGHERNKQHKEMGEWGGGGAERGRKKGAGGGNAESACVPQYHTSILFYFVSILYLSLGIYGRQTVPGDCCTYTLCPRFIP